MRGAESTALSRRGLFRFCGSVVAGALLVRATKALAAVAHRIVVTDFGAIGDGKTDCTAAFQAAVNAADCGEVVYMPPGVYRIDSKVGFGARAGKKVKMKGAGADKTGIYWDSGAWA